MKTICLPVDETMKVCLPHEFEEFLTFFGVVHEDGRNEIRWFVQVHDNDMKSPNGETTINHINHYRRYNFHRESVITAVGELKRHHVVILGGHPYQQTILIHDASELALRLADSEEGRLFFALDNWVQVNYGLYHEIDRRPFVLMLQHILFPYYVRKKMTDEFGNERGNNADLPRAFEIYFQGSWYPKDDIHMQQERGAIDLYEYSVTDP